MRYYLIFFITLNFLFFKKYAKFFSDSIFTNNDTWNKENGLSFIP